MAQERSLDIFEEDGLPVRASNIFGKNKAADVNNFRGCTYVHVSNTSNKKVVTMTLEEFANLCSLEEEINEFADLLTGKSNEQNKEEQDAFDSMRNAEKRGAAEERSTSSGSSRGGGGKGS